MNYKGGSFAAALITNKKINSLVIKQQIKTLMKAKRLTMIATLMAVAILFVGCKKEKAEKIFVI